MIGMHITLVAAVAVGLGVGLRAQAPLPVAHGGGPHVGGARDQPARDEVLLEGCLVRAWQPEGEDGAGIGRHDVFLLREVVPDGDEYRLVPGSGVALSIYERQTVAVRGRVTARSRGGEPAWGVTGRPMVRQVVFGDRKPDVVLVTSVRMIAPTCGGEP